MNHNRPTMPCLPRRGIARSIVTITVQGDGWRRQIRMEHMPIRKALRLIDTIGEDATPPSTPRPTGHGHGCVIPMRRVG